MIYDCLIVGAGPGGLSAALYFGRAGVSTIIIEKSAPGGKVITTSSVENYPGVVSSTGPNLALNMMAQIKPYSIPFKYEEVIEITKDNDLFITKTNQNTYTSKYVIVSTGTINRQLGVAGEMKYMNRGVSYCAICDGMLYKDKEVMVVGAGNSAFEESLYLAKICKKVSIVHRSTSFRASAELIEKVKNTENIKLITDTTVESFNGDNILKSVTLKHLDSKEEYMVDGVFIYIGFIPCTDFLKEFNVLDDAGFIKVDQNCETSVEGLYAVGDCTNHVVKQIGCAVGHGITASNIIIKKL